MSLPQDKHHLLSCFILLNLLPFVVMFASKIIFASPFLTHRMIFSASSSNSDTSHATHFREEVACYLHCLHCDAVVFNLFAIRVAVSIAEALCVPCVCIHPYFIPSADPPSWFLPAFKRRLGALFRVLNEQPQYQPQQSHQSWQTELQLSSHVAWSEVEHWLWPVFVPLLQELMDRER